MKPIECERHWALTKTSSLPARWQALLLRRWNFDPNSRVEKLDRAANIALRETVESLGNVRMSLDSSDSEIITAAESCAMQCADVARLLRESELRRATMDHFCKSRGITPPAKKISDDAAMLRMACPRWWRRALRALYASSVELSAIRLGYINARSDLYVSHETVARRLEQLRRNERSLAAVTLENDNGQRYTLAEIAATGVSNKTIRHAELMTRISGFEVIARDLGHSGVFMTLTCPSRMHKWIRLSNHTVAENKSFDGTSPRNAQLYLRKCWARARAALARIGITVYGFRIAEPHHDGCPHWHMLFFIETEVYRATIKTIRRYFVAADREEAGASRHRVTYKHIKPSQGSAAGYIAKYISKNIGTHHVENDMFGNPIVETSQRVDAWASTWRIRQFQQLGGPPVGVWRALRRITIMPDDAPTLLHDAHAACHKTVDDELVRAASWAGYIRAQGGIIPRSDCKITLDKSPVLMLNSYGEQRPDRIIGVAILAAREYMIGRFRALGELIKYVAAIPARIWQRVCDFAGDSPPRTSFNNCTRAALA